MTAFRIHLPDNTTRVVYLPGRVSWALSSLMEAGEAGCTPIDTPGPRWSQYVFVLRGHGIEVETIREPHGPPFPGFHARYVLRTRVEALEEAA